jgi:hypothetical protein
MGEPRLRILRDQQVRPRRYELPEEGIGRVRWALWIAGVLGMAAIAAAVMLGGR